VLLLLQDWWCQFKQTGSSGKRVALHSSHPTNKADMTLQF
jgi:hypothetical protein